MYIYGEVNRNKAFISTFRKSVSISYRRAFRIRFFFSRIQLGFPNETFKFSYKLNLSLTDTHC